MEKVEKEYLDARIAFTKALSMVQGKLKPAVKGTENTYFKSKYADLTAVWDACRELLTENGFAVTQGCVYHDSHIFLRTGLLHVCSHAEYFDYPIKPVKEDPQAYGSAVTYARRYSLAALVGICTEDDDANAASEPAKVSPHATPQAQQVVAKPSASDFGKASIGVVSITPKEVKKKDGTMGIAYEIKGDNGISYGTFREDIASEASSCKDEARPFEFHYAQSGRFYNIVRLSSDAPKSDKKTEPIPF